jgi:beta-glucosidase
MNEPWCISILGYVRGVFAPGRSSDRERSLEGGCKYSKAMLVRSVPENHTPFSVGHSVILPHAYAVKVYRDKLKPSQKGEIGITVNGSWAMPYDDSP